MEILFLANGAFAVPALTALHAAGHRLDLVVQPDPPKRRRGEAVESPVAAWARENGIPFRQPENLSDPAFLESVRARAFPVGFAVDYGKKVPRVLFDLPRAGIWNLHPSLLPKYRGAAPIPWTILAGDAETGVTLFRIVERMDAGPVLIRYREAVRPADDAVSLHARLSGIAAATAIEGVARLAAGSLVETPQDEAAATVARKLVKEDGRVDWNEPADAIERRSRALKPWPGLFTTWTHPKRGRVTLVLDRVALSEEPGLAPGEVRVAAGRLHAGAGRGAIEILALHPEGAKGTMDAASFLRGYPLASGDRLGAA